MEKKTSVFEIIDDKITTIMRGDKLPLEIVVLKDKITAARWSLSLGLASFVDGIVYSSEEEVTRLRELSTSMHKEWLSGKIK
jgi:hypothetical protein